MPGHLRAPWVSASRFLQGFARRCESQCRQDWTALPVMRTVTFKYLVERLAKMAAEQLTTGQDLVKMHLCALYVVHLT